MNVWPGNATLINWLQTQGTERKSPRTIVASYKLCDLQDDAILTMEP